MRDRRRPRTRRDKSVTSVPDIALLRAVIEAVADVVVVTSPELDPPGPVIEYVNPAFTVMTGYAAEETVGRSPRFLQGPATDRAHLDRLRASLAQGGPFEGEAINYRKDGCEYVVEWLITAVRDEAGVVRHWVAVQRDVTERRRLEARQAVLVAELQHRTRNLLAVAHAVAAQTLQPGPGMADYHGRLAALGRVQGLLSRGQDWSVRLAELVHTELHALGAASADRVRIRGPAVELSGDMVQSVAMVLHELATNAVKHGALARPGGRLEVDWRIDEAGSDPGRSQLVLCWRESGVSLPEMPPAHRGYGRELIEHALPYTLDGRTSLEFTREGVRCDITLPLAAKRPVP